MIPGMPDNWRDELRLFLGIMLTAALAGILTDQLLSGLLLGLLRVCFVSPPDPEAPVALRPEPSSRFGATACCWTPKTPA